MKVNIVKIAAAISTLALIVGVEAVADTSKDMFRLMKSGGHVLMLRHAYAPGTGDPENFKIGDCSTQRNLDAQGRSQAIRIVKRLQEKGIRSARVFSSQWCRCIETAEALGLGPVAELPSLNSFFERPQDREPNLNALKAFLSTQSTHGGLIILVTHFVTISAITGEGVGSGEGFVLRLAPKGNLKVIGRLAL